MFSLFSRPFFPPDAPSDALWKVEAPGPWPPPPPLQQRVNRHATVLIEGPCTTLLTLFHLKSKTYRCPGGKLEPGELAIAAAARELFEEVGIEALELIHLQTTDIHVDGDDWHGDWFLCKRFIGVPRNADPAKHAELKYLSLEELRSLGGRSEYGVYMNYLYPRGQ